MQISATTGAGLDAWLAEVLSDAPAGAHIAEVDYDIYADGEAALGWLNAAIKLRSPNPVDWKRFCLDLLKNFRSKLQETKSEAAHVKVALNSEGTALIANLTSSRGQPFLLVQGTQDGPTREAKLLFNARVQTPPEVLRDMAESTVRETCGTAIKPDIGTLQAFKPGRPVPVHRFKRA
jgi:hypothetical protein